jgi:hypothetical protein
MTRIRVVPDRPQPTKKGNTLGSRCGSNLGRSGRRLQLGGFSGQLAVNRLAYSRESAPMQKLLTTIALTFVAIAVLPASAAAATAIEYGLICAL